MNAQAQQSANFFAIYFYGQTIFGGEKFNALMINNLAFEIEEDTVLY